MTNINPPILSLQDAIKIVDLENKPILFFDTCALLDILRICIPERHIAELDKHLIEVKRLIDNNNVICFSSKLCIKEFNDHSSSIINSYESELNKIQSPVNKYLEIVNNSNIYGNLPIINLNTYSMKKYFSDIVIAIVNKTNFIDEDDDFKEAAHTRVIEKKSPAKNKGEYKDCYIWETFLQLIRNRASHATNAYFISSNKKDYCNQSDFDKFEVDLEGDITGFNIQFALNQTKLFHKLQKDKIL